MGFQLTSEGLGKHMSVEERTQAPELDITLLRTASSPLAREAANFFKDLLLEQNKADDARVGSEKQKEVSSKDKDQGSEGHVSLTESSSQQAALDELPLFTRAVSSGGLDLENGEAHRLDPETAAQPAAMSRPASSGDYRSKLRPLFQKSATMDSAARKDALPTKLRWEIGAMYPVIPGRLYFTCHTSEDMTRAEINKRPRLFFCSSDLQEQYMPFCSDFGPVDLGMVLSFRQYLKEKLEHPKLKLRPIVYYCDARPEHLTNCAFLLASFLVLELGMSPADAVAPFLNMSPSPFRMFRDATFQRSSFDLSLQDCCEGLAKAVKLGWLDVDTFDMDQYEMLDSPDHGDMHLVNHKFVAFRGPVDADSPHLEDDGCTLPAEHFVPIFKQLGVKAVIRLNEPDTYNPSVFEQADIRHYDLFFEDCTTPSEDICEKFLNICDAEPGRVAVHCLAGLGRTGTLIALWMMKNYGLSARECIGWLRVVRPGCIIGPQQHFLEDRSGLPWVGNNLPKPNSTTTAVSKNYSKQLAAQVKAASAHRAERAERHHDQSHRSRS